MGSEALLKSACELSYVIARDGVESDPPLEPPQAMRTFLYVADLPDRALALAKQAIEDDPAFRRRVAEQANEADVGRGGYLWLHRPIGWSAEFEELVTAGGQQAMTAGDAQDQSIDDDTDEHERVAVGVVETVPAIAENVAGDSGGGDPGRWPSFSAGQWGSEHDRSSDVGTNDEANAIESELSSLRGLVDRLANERQAVASSVERAEAQMESARHQPSMFDSDLYTLQSELESAQEELAAARQERDLAVQQHSASLTRQLELEKELDRARELRAAVEREHAESDAAQIELQESLVRLEGTAGALQMERDELTLQVESLSAHNEELMTELARLNQERATSARALDAEREAMRQEITTLETQSKELTARLSGVESELAESVAELGLTANQASEAKSLVEVLTEEKIDLASRLADTEAMLDTTRTQLGAVKTDAEALSADLAGVRSQRDGLSTQVEELHSSLTEALDKLARVRETSDADRDALKGVRTERDQLRLRVSTLEQAEAGLEAKLAGLTAERSTLQSRMDEIKSELGELERANGELVSRGDSLDGQLSEMRAELSSLGRERDELQRQLEEERGRAQEFEIARDGLAQQVHQLTADNTAIQDQLVESDRLRVETSESQGHALSELAQRLSLVENDRAKLQDRMVNLEAELAEARASVTSTRAALTEAQEALEEARAETEKAKADAERSVADALGARAGADETQDHTGEAATTDETEKAEPTDVVGSDGDESAMADETIEAEIEAPVEPEVEIEKADDGAEATSPDEEAVRAEAARDDVEVARDDLDERDDAEAVDVEGAVDEVTAEAPAGGLGELTAHAVADDGVDVAVGEAVLEDEADVEAELEETLTGGRARAAALAGAEGDDAVDQPESGFLRAIPEEDELDGEDDSSSTKRHAWSLGPFLRGRKGNGDEAAAEADLPPPPGIESELDEGDFDAVAAAVAEAVRNADLTPDDEVESSGDQDLSLIGAKLADAMSDSSQPEPQEDVVDDDLDAISDLISQTVSGFDAKDGGDVAEFAGDDEAADDESADEPGVWGTMGASVEDSVLPEDRGPAGRDGASTPPSIFNGTHGQHPFDEDPFASQTSPADRPDSAAAQEGSAGRRRIPIPDALLDDEVEMARHVVSSPDVVLLVDGDSVAKMGWPSLPVAQQRDALVSYLADLSASSGAAPDVVFDGRIGEEEALPASRAVRIRLSTPPTEPAAALDELVDAYPEQWPIAVVTDDDALAASAVERGAVALNNGQLLDLFIAQ
jgi:chromosome segregation ATPase